MYTKLRATVACENNASCNGVFTYFFPASDVAFAYSLHLLQ
jgi:hypothetical protein